MTAKSSGSKATPSLLRGTAVVSALTIVSRILGFVRDLLVARLFGASMYADSFFVAFRIPNLLRSFVAEGALTSAFVPVFSSALNKDKEQAQSTLSRVTSFLLLTTFILTVLGVIFSGPIVSIFAPGFASSPEKQDLCIKLTQIMMPYIMCISLIAMLNAALNTVHIYGVAAFSQVLMNLALIAGALAAMFFDAQPASYILAWSVLVGGLIQVIAQIPTAKKSGFTLRPARSFWGPEIKDLLKLMGPALIGASIYQISIFIATLLASLLEAGSVSWLFYADRIAQFPIGVYSVALASVLLPALSHAHAKDDATAFESRLLNSLRFTSFCLIPLSIFIFTLSVPIVQIIFQRGRFDAYSTLRTASALQGLCIGIWFTSCHSMLIRAFIAKRDTLTPTCIGAISLLVSVLLSLLLMGAPVSGAEGSLAQVVSNIQNTLTNFAPSLSLGPSGLTVSSSLAAVVSLLLAVLILSRRNPNIGWGSFVRSTWQSLFCSLIASIPLIYLLKCELSATLCLSIGVFGFMAIYLILGLLLRSSEVKETFSLISRLLNRTA